MNRTLTGRRVEAGVLPVQEVKRAIAPHVDAAAELRPRLMKAIETFPRPVVGVREEADVHHHGGGGLVEARVGLIAENG